mgnify:CR=1 FL=1
MMRNGSDTLDPPRRMPSRGAEKETAISFQPENGRPTPPSTFLSPPPTLPPRSSKTTCYRLTHYLPTNLQVERVFMMLAVPADSYGLRHVSDPSFFEGRCAEIFLKKNGQVVGLFGTVHPEVLGNFDLPYPTSAAEIDLQAFL